MRRIPSLQLGLLEKFFQGFPIVISNDDECDLVRVANDPVCCCHLFRRNNHHDLLKKKAEKGPARAACTGLCEILSI